MNALTAPIAAYLAAVILAKLATMARPSTAPLALFVIVGGGVGVGMLAALLPNSPPVTGLTAALLYGAMCEFHLIVMTMVMTSISVSLLTRLRDGEATLAEIEAVYDEREMVEKRFSRLLSQGLIESLGQGRYAITAKGERLYSLLGRLRHWFHGR